MHSGLHKLSLVERSADTMSSQLVTQLLNNLSLILIGLNRNAEALFLFNEAIERDPRTSISICVCLRYEYRILGIIHGRKVSRITSFGTVREKTFAIHLHLCSCSPFCAGC